MLHVSCCTFVLLLEKVAANRVTATNTPIDDTDPTWKFSIDPGSYTDLHKPAEFTPKGSPCGMSVSITHSEIGIVEGGELAPKVAPRRLGLFTPKLTIFYRISVETSQFQGP